MHYIVKETKDEGNWHLFSNNSPLLFLFPPLLQTSIIDVRLGAEYVSVQDHIEFNVSSNINECIKVVLFLLKRFHKHKKHKTHIGEQK